MGLPTGLVRRAGFVAGRTWADASNGRAATERLAEGFQVVVPVMVPGQHQQVAAFAVGEGKPVGAGDLVAVAPVGAVRIHLIAPQYEQLAPRQTAWGYLIQVLSGGKRDRLPKCLWLMMDLWTVRSMRPRGLVSGSFA